jgi:glycosyltransferase involved in cell wall biosynthesis
MPSQVDSRPIAVVMRALEGGGAQRDSILLCNALAATGTPVAILALRTDGPLASLLDPAVRVFEIPGRRIRYALPGLRRLIPTVDPRLVLSSESNLNLCTLAAVKSLPRRRRPKLVLREVASPSAAQEHDPYLQNRIAYGLLRYLYRHADRIVVLTDGARTDLAQNFSIPAHKISVMRANAVIPPAVMERIKQWDGEDGREPNLIVSVGRLSPEKGHRQLLHAMTLVRSDRPWRLALVGDGSERATLEAFVRDHHLSQRTTFTGFVTDPFAWMMRASVAVCSSIYEGFGNAVVEALACGTPVVSTDCPYGPREILQDGRYGTLVPVDDAPSLASAIEDALERPVDRKTLMKRGFDYTSERAAHSFLEIVADL